MQPAPSTRIPDGFLAAMRLEGEKPHQGLPSRNPAPNPVREVCKFTVLLGMRGQAELNRAGSCCTGKERDTESGNDYFEARYYSSAMGRFMSPDWSAKEEPVPYAMMDNPQSLNLYSYVENNPKIRVDADGHCYPWCTIAAGALIGAGIEAGLEMYHGEKINKTKVFAAAVGGGIAGATLGLGAGTGVIGMAAAGALGNTAGGIVERGIVTGKASEAFDGKKMIEDEFVGGLGGAAAHYGEGLGRRLAGGKEFDRLEKRVLQRKLSVRHRTSIQKQINGLEGTVATGEHSGEVLAHKTVDAVHSTFVQSGEKHEK